ncbi:MAG TPA: hypothetical protein VI756_11370, partial [Blastocatellia bacterium]
ISGFLSRVGYDQIIFGDIDSCLCPTQRKAILRDKKFGASPEVPVFVVELEIESWFLAGLDENGLRHLGLPPIANAHRLSKERFDNSIPKKFYGSRIDFMTEITKVFSVEAAKYNNRSFRYFADKILRPKA